jgi:hypothetical protein
MPTSIFYWRPAPIHPLLSWLLLQEVSFRDLITPT